MTAGPDLERFRLVLQSERDRLVHAAQAVHHEGSLLEETGDLAIGSGDHLADSATELDAARMLMLKAADARTRKERPALEAAMAKLAASEAAHRAADRAMQILASHGYQRGSVVERLFRDVRATEIYQGTSEVQRMVIAEHILG